MITRQQAIRGARELAHRLEECNKHLQGALIIMYALADRADGTLKLTGEEIKAARESGGKLQAEHMADGSITLTAHLPLLTDEELKAEMARRGDVFAGDEIPADGEVTAPAETPVAEPTPPSAPGDATGTHAE